MKKLSFSNHDLLFVFKLGREKPIPVAEFEKKVAKNGVKRRKYAKV